MGKPRGGVNKRKLSGTKLANKQQYKLGKQGKIRQMKSKIKKKQKAQLIRKKIQAEAGKPPPDPEEVVQSSDDEEQEQQNREFFSTAQTSFAFSINNTDAKNKRKRKHKSHDDEADTLENQYEGKLTNGESNKRIKLGLPLRQKKEVIEQIVTDDEEEEESVSDEEQNTKTEKKQEELVPLSVADIYVSRQQKLAEYKYKIASLASAVLENPEQNYRKLKELRIMLDESQPDVFVSVRKLATASLLELFLDIIPSYRINVQPEQAGQQLKKETRSLRDYETSLLSNYRYYLQYLQGLLKGQRRLQNKKLPLILKKLHVDDSQQAAFAALAARCMSRLLAEKPHFNFRSNIINVIVPFMDKKAKEISNPIYEAICSVFQSDKSGEVVLEVVLL